MNIKASHQQRKWRYFIKISQSTRTCRNFIISLNDHIVSRSLFFRIILEKQLGNLSILWTKNPQRWQLLVRRHQRLQLWLGKSLHYTTSVTCVWYFISRAVTVFSSFWTSFFPPRTSMPSTFCTQLIHTCTYIQEILLYFKTLLLSLRVYCTPVCKIRIKIKYLFAFI